MNRLDRPWVVAVGVAVLLGAMLTLMWRPLHEDSLTADECVFMTAGYSYWHGHRYFLNVEHPPLMQLWSAVPLLAMNIHESPDALVALDPNLPAPFEELWNSKLQAVPPGIAPVPEFYVYRAPHQGRYASRLSFSSGNDLDQMVFWSRLMQALVTLAVGALIFLWARSLGTVAGGLLAMGVWVFNPLALAYGHMVLTDPGMALCLPLAVWMFARMLERPTARRTILAGLALGAALLTKFTAVLLVPIFGVIAIVWWVKSPRPVALVPRQFVGRMLAMAGIGWVLVLIFYFPHWAPAPPITAASAARLEVPRWFLALRPMLIPAEYFKGLAIVLNHATTFGHESYLMGNWSHDGWWYYFPVALLVKTPVVLLLLTLGAIVWMVWQVRRLSFSEITPALAATVYLACAMTSKANIGVRHMLPLFPLLAVAVAVAVSRWSKWPQAAAGAAVALMAATSVWTCPLYLTYFNELVGGPTNGHRWLLDSNFDWGQDVKRLAAYLRDEGIGHVYVCTLGPRGALDHEHIHYTDVRPADLTQIKDGWLVVSATFLMQPDWAAWRESHTPVTRIAHTLFVYRIDQK